MSLVAGIRKKFKRLLYGKVPGFSGSFPYFGSRVHFPPGDYIFNEACRQGIYEQETLRALQACVRPGTVMIDVGSNIGLHSAAILETVPGCFVLSFEPSPVILPYLRATVSGSPHSKRWCLLDYALSDAEGQASFSAPAAGLSAFGGLRNTGRVKEDKVVEVRLRTLDSVWIERESQPVSVLKIDTEGHDLPVLLGAASCITACRPVIVMEWNRLNLSASGYAPSRLMEWASQNQYDVFTLLGMTPVQSNQVLHLMMNALNHENFVLLPR